MENHSEQLTEQLGGAGCSFMRIVFTSHGLEPGGVARSSADICKRTNVNAQLCSVSPDCCEHGMKSPLKFVLILVVFFPPMQNSF